MSDTKTAVVTLGSQEADANFGFLKEDAALVWIMEHSGCPDCPTPSVPKFHEVGQLSKPNLSEVLKEAKTWADSISTNVRCAVCPGPWTPTQLYQTGPCDHKFCEDCMEQRNFVRKECCVCDVRFEPQLNKVDEIYWRLGMRLQKFIEDVQLASANLNQKQDTSGMKAGTGSDSGSE